MYRVRRLQYFGISFLVVLLLSSVSVSAARPYVRAYGNDVIAGGGYGAGCTSDPTDDVLGFGRYTGPSDHSGYVGAGAELGVFSPGSIEELLPGASVTTPRSALWELSFANTVGGTTSAAALSFGGGFLPASCLDDFPDPLSEPGWVTWSGTDVTLPTGEIICDYLDLSTLPDGAKIYIQSSAFHFGAGCGSDAASSRGHIATIGNGKTVTLMIDANLADPTSFGELAILSNIVYENADTVGWNDIDDIPVLKVYVKGNLKIDYSVDVVSGIFYAGSNGSGHIWTCTRSSDLLSPNSGGPSIVDEIADNCGKKLTVYGALIGNRTNLYRINGDINALGAVVGEVYTSPGLAEAIVFSPEIYLGLLSDQGPPTISTGKVDSIRSLPPAF